MEFVTEIVIIVVCDRLMTNIVDNFAHFVTVFLTNCDRAEK